MSFFKALNRTVWGIVALFVVYHLLDLLGANSEVIKGFVGFFSFVYAIIFLIAWMLIASDQPPPPPEPLPSKVFNKPENNMGRGSKRKRNYERNNSNKQLSLECACDNNDPHAKETRTNIQLGKNKRIIKL